MILLFIGLILAIAVLHLIKKDTDDVMRSLLSLITLVCLALSLICAPWFIQLLLVIVLLSAPTCGYKPSVTQVSCPSWCTLRLWCSPPDA
jgi:ABC-type Fe3+-siderophore transport system permease subunit